MSESLWGNMPDGTPAKIEVYGCTGALGDGKTLGGLTIAPGVHPDGHAYAGKPRTLYLDFEKSGGMYEALGCKRIDVPVELMRKHGKKYGPRVAYEWFVEQVEKVKEGQYDVIIADPITDVEGGMVDWVKANPPTGLSVSQMTKGGGLLWGAVKDLWKQVLLLLSSKCQTFYFTAHLRSVWVGGAPTGKKEPKGKDTLMELASLYLRMDRSPDKKGKRPECPSAEVLKSRLSTIDISTMEITQLLPDRLPKANVEAIRHYIANPPDPKKPKAGERIVIREQTEEEKIAAKIRLAEAQTEAANAEMAAAEMRGEKPKASTKEKVVEPPAKPKAEKPKPKPASVDDESDDEQFLKLFIQGRRLDQSSPDFNDRRDADKPVTEDQKRAATLFIGIRGGKAELKRGLEPFGVKKFSELDMFEADCVILNMADWAAAKK